MGPLLKNLIDTDVEGFPNQVSWTNGISEGFWIGSSSTVVKQSQKGPVCHTKPMEQCEGTERWNAWERGWTGPGEEGRGELRSPEKQWPASSSTRFQRKHALLSVLGFGGKPFPRCYCRVNSRKGPGSRGLPHVPTVPWAASARWALLPKNRRGLQGPGDAEHVAMHLLPHFPAFDPNSGKDAPREEWFPTEVDERDFGWCESAKDIPGSISNGRPQSLSLWFLIQSLWANVRHSSVR